MDISNRKVLQFRCHIAQHIGPKVQNAFVPKDMGATAEIAYCKDGPVGVYLKLSSGREHVIGFNNIEAILLEPEEAQEATEARKVGRPKIV